MADRLSPPSWTEWTRNPSERSPQRKEFDDILGELRKEGLIEVKGSLFVHLARYSFLQTKDATIDVRAFTRSVPDSVFGPTPPSYRGNEVESVIRILADAGLCRVTAQDGAGIVEVVLTSRQSAGEVTRNQISLAVLSHLRDVFRRWDPAALVHRASSFPTPETVAIAAQVDRELLVPGGIFVGVSDRPESNDTNPAPFLQETVERSHGSILLLQFWPLPDPKGSGGGTEPEFSLLVPAEIPLASLVKDYAIPVLGEYFKSNEHHDLATEIQAKYANYMHKYREKFAASAGIVITDKIDKVLTTADPEGEAFANAVYVLAQVLRAALKEKMSNLRASNNPIVYQAARIAYAQVMAVRVKKRRAEKDAASRQSDSQLLVARLKESPRPLSLDELKRTPDATKNVEIGAKYASIIEMLPLVPAREGARPVVFELAGGFVHRESLLRTFLELRDRESGAQRGRLAQDWARTGIPPVDEVFLLDRDVSADFLKALELIHQERVLAQSTPEFAKEFIAGERELLMMARGVWPDGHRGAITPVEVISRGLDVILYEDKDRLRRRSLVGVLNLGAAYPAIVKETWNIVFVEDGLLRFLLRKLMAFFGGRMPKRKPKEPAAPAVRSVATGPKAVDHSGAREADYRRLVSLAPAVADRVTLARDRDKLAAQWCLKLDQNAGRKTLDAVDDEVGRLVVKVKPDLLAEENSAKVALYLVEKSPVLAQVTSSRAYHRYLYLTALEKMAAFFGK
jgi:hypothetical protein